VVRIVLDSNVYVSALNFGGPPETIVRLARRGTFVVFTSDFIRAEVVRVLSKKFGWSQARVEDALRLLEPFVRLVQPSETVVGVCDDPDDDHILACAVEAGADVIVSGDHALQAIGRFRDIAILSPRGFLESRFWEQVGRRN
jgi:putative PIN family toxin of toxin-antitoxin system